MISCRTTKLKYHRLPKGSGCFTLPVKDFSIMKFATSSSMSSPPTSKSPDQSQRNGPIPKPCAVCRRRKVRCDKGKPFCSNCVRSNSLCSYDDAGQLDPYAVSRSLDSAQDLQKRISRLENMIENMAGVSLNSQDTEDPDSQKSDPQKRSIPAPPVGSAVAWEDPAKIPVGISIFEHGSSVYIDPGSWVELFDQV